MCTTDWPTHSTLKGKSDRISCIQSIPKKHPPVTLRISVISASAMKLSHPLLWIWHSVFQLSAESRHVCIRFARAWFQLKGERMRDTSMQKKNSKKTRYDTLQYAWKSNDRMFFFAMARQRKNDIRQMLCTLLTLPTLWLRSHRFLGDFIPLAQIAIFKHRLEDWNNMKL